MLLLLHIALQALTIFGAAPVWQPIADRFNVDLEASVPTWFSQILLGASALSAWLISRIRSIRGWAMWQWRFIAIILLSMSIDEGASFHETLGVGIGQYLGVEINLGVIVLRDWVVLGIGFMLLLGVLFLKFFLTLPVGTRLLLLTGSVIFLLGAVGWESLHFTTFNFVHNDPSFAARLSVAIEEGLEMAGAIIVLYAFLDFARRVSPELKLTLR